MPVAQLSIDLVARLAGLEQGMQRAASLSEQTAQKIDNSFGRLKALAAGIGGALAGAFTVDALKQFIHANADALDALNDVSDATGAAIEAISGLDTVARRNGGTLQDVSDILVKFNAALKDADGKNGVSRALQAIGLSAKELRGLDPAEALQKAALALNEFEDGGNKARITQELFGKSIKEAAPFLKDLAEAGKVHGKVTTDQAAAAERFNKALAAFQTNSADSARTITLQMLPALTKWMENLNALGGVVGAFNALIGRDEMGQLKTRAKDLTAQSELIGMAVEKLALVTKANPTDENVKRLEALREQLRALTSDAADASAALKKLAPVPIPAHDQAELDRFTPPPKKRPTPDTGGGGTTEIDKVQAYIDALMQEQVAQLDLTRLEKARFDLLGDELAKATSGQRLFILETAKSIDLGKQKKIDIFEGDNDGALERRARAQADAQQRLNDILAQTPTKQLEQARIQLEFLADALEKSGDPKQTQAIKEAMKSIADAANVLPTSLDDASADAARRVESTLGDTLTQVMSGKFDGIVNLWIQMLLRMEIEAASADLTKSIFKSGGSGLFGLLGLFGGGSSAGAAGAGTVGPGLHFATGGVFDGATPFAFGNSKLGVLGEAGPEAVMPLRRGSDGRLGVVAAGGGGGFHFHQTNIIGSTVNRNDVTAAMFQAKEAAKAEIYDAQRRGRR